MQKKSASMRRGAGGANGGASALKKKKASGEAAYDVIELRDELRRVRLDLNERVEACKILKTNNNRLRDECRAFEKRTGDLESLEKTNGQAMRGTMAPPVVRALKKSVRSLSDKLVARDRRETELLERNTELEGQLEEAEKRLQSAENELRALTRQRGEAVDEAAKLRGEIEKVAESRQSAERESKEVLGRMEAAQEKARAAADAKAKQLPAFAMKGWRTMWATAETMGLGTTSSSPLMPNASTASGGERKHHRRISSQDGTEFRGGTRNALLLPFLDDEDEPLTDEAVDWEAASRCIVGDGSRISCELRIQQASIRIKMDGDRTSPASSSSTTPSSRFTFVTVRLAASKKLQCTTCVEEGPGPADYTSRFIFDMPLDRHLVELVTRNSVTTSMYVTEAPLAVVAEVSVAGMARDIEMHGVGGEDDDGCPLAILLFERPRGTASAPRHFVGMLNTFADGLPRGCIAVDARAVATKGSRLNACLSSGIFSETNGHVGDLQIWRMTKETNACARRIGSAALGLDALTDSPQHGRRSREISLTRASASRHGGDTAPIAQQTNTSSVSDTTAILCYTFWAHRSLAPMCHMYNELSKVAMNPAAIAAVSGHESVDIVVGRQTEKMYSVMDSFRNELLQILRKNAVPRAAQHTNATSPSTIPTSPPESIHSAENLRPLLGRLYVSMNEFVVAIYASAWSGGQHVKRQDRNCYLDHIVCLVTEFKNNFSNLVSRTCADAHDIASPCTQLRTSMNSHYDGTLGAQGLEAAPSMLADSVHQCETLLSQLVASVESLVRMQREVKSAAPASLTGLKDAIQGVLNQAKTAFVQAVAKANAVENTDAGARKTSGSTPSTATGDVNIDAVVLNCAKLVSTEVHMSMPKLVEIFAVLFKTDDSEEQKHAEAEDTTLSSNAQTLPTPTGRGEDLIATRAAHLKTEDEAATGHRTPGTTQATTIDVYGTDAIAALIDWLRSEHDALEAALIKEAGSEFLIVSRSGLLQIFIKVSDFFLFLEELIEDGIIFAMGKERARHNICSFITASVARAKHDTVYSKKRVHTVTQGFARGDVSRSSEEGVSLIMSFKRMQKRIVKRITRTSRLIFGLLVSYRLPQYSIALIASSKVKDTGNLTFLVKLLAHVCIKAHIFYHDSEVADGDPAGTDKNVHADGNDKSRQSHCNTGGIDVARIRRDTRAYIFFADVEKELRVARSNPRMSTSGQTAPGTSSSPASLIEEELSSSKDGKNVHRIRVSCAATGNKDSMYSIATDIYAAIASFLVSDAVFAAPHENARRVLRNAFADLMDTAEDAFSTGVSLQGKSGELPTWMMASPAKTEPDLDLDEFEETMETMASNATKCFEELKKMEAFIKASLLILLDAQTIWEEEHRARTPLVASGTKDHGETSKMTTPASGLSPSLQAGAMSTLPPPTQQPSPPEVSGRGFQFSQNALFQEEDVIDGGRVTVTNTSSQAQNSSLRLSGTQEIPVRDRGRSPLGSSSVSAPADLHGASPFGEMKPSGTGSKLIAATSLTSSNLVTSKSTLGGESTGPPKEELSDSYLLRKAHEEYQELLQQQREREREAMLQKTRMRREQSQKKQEQQSQDAQPRHEAKSDTALVQADNATTLSAHEGRDDPTKLSTPEAVKDAQGMDVDEEVIEEISEEKNIVSSQMCTDSKYNEKEAGTPGGKADLVREAETKDSHTLASLQATLQTTVPSTQAETATSKESQREVERATNVNPLLQVKAGMKAPSTLQPLKDREATQLQRVLPALTPLDSKQESSTSKNAKMDTGTESPIVAGTTGAAAPASARLHTRDGAVGAPSTSEEVKPSSKSSIQPLGASTSKASSVAPPSTSASLKPTSVANADGHASGNIVPKDVDDHEPIQPLYDSHADEPIKPLYDSLAAAAAAAGGGSKKKKKKTSSSDSTSAKKRWKKVAAAKSIKAPEPSLLERMAMALKPDTDDSDDFANTGSPRGTASTLSSSSAFTTASGKIVTKDVNDHEPIKPLYDSRAEDTTVKAKSSSSSMTSSTVLASGKIVTKDVNDHEPIQPLYDSHAETSTSLSKSTSLAAATASAKKPVGQTQSKRRISLNIFAPKASSPPEKPRVTSPVSSGSQNQSAPSPTSTDDDIEVRTIKFTDAMANFPW